jgi:hypothetical protein
MKLQRTGLTEGSLLYNEWLKQFGLYREDTEAEFINWLYSTSGWYDKDIKGSYFDIDVEAVKKSENYHRFLDEFCESLFNSDWFHLMLHSSWHLNGLEMQSQFTNHFSVTNRSYWREPQFLKDLVKGQRVLVVSSIADLIAEKHGVLAYQTPTTHLNSGDEKNSWETLDKVTKEIADLTSQFDIALVSFGAYGCLLVDRLCKMGKSAATIGSGVYELYPVGVIPKEKRPTGWEKIEDGRYWKNPA